MKKSGKKVIPSKIIGILFVCLISIYMISIIICFLSNNHGKTNIAVLPSETDLISNDKSDLFDWSEKYPFDISEKFTYSEKKETVKEENSFFKNVNLFKDNVDYYATNLLFGRMKFVEANALFNKFVGNKIIVANDSVTVMKNGYLTFLNEEKDVSYAAQSLEWFSKKMSEKNIDFMYIQYPSKESVNDNQLPNGVSDNNNKNITKLLEKLNRSNVNVIDFRSLLTMKSGNYYENFFKTDHHWKPETGVWASGEIIKLLNENFSYSFDAEIGNIKHYNSDVYEKFCLGSQGRIATLSYAEPEDISVIYPKSETDYTVTYNEKTVRNGTFKQALINESIFDSIDYYGVSTYSAYLFGNNAVVNIKNNKISNGKRIVFVTDSFGNTVAPYLSQVYEFTDVIDMRIFNGSLLSYIEQKKPDTVIVGVSPSNFTQDNSHSSPFNLE